MAQRRAALHEFCTAAEIDGDSTNPEMTVLVAQNRPNPHTDAWTARELGDPGDADEVVLPDFCPESELDDVQAQLQRRLQLDCRRVRVTSLYGLQLLAEEGALDDVVCTCCFPLPTANHLAVACLRHLGADRVGAWVELDRDAFEALLNATPEPLEVLTYGRLPILATRAELPVTGKVKDDRGNAYEILPQKAETLLLPEIPLAVSPRPAHHQYIDLRHVGPEAPKTSSFNYDFDWT